MLMVNGSPLRLIGYNWHWMGTGCSVPTDAQLDDTFAQIKTASHGNVVRTAFYQSGSNDGAYTDFDRYILYAKHYGLYIVPMLVNQLASCEPTKTMERGRWYQAGYTQPNDGYPLSFRDYAIRLAQHYANEPTIAFWQLVNEPDAAPCGAAGAQTLRNFADDMTTALKTVDLHHMVDLGVPGQCAGDTPADYMQVVSGQVDLCDVWHDYEQIATPLPSQMAQRLNICQHLNKPSFVGESGICADVTASQTCSGVITSTSLHKRATLFAAKLDAGFNEGLAGYILWNKGDKSVQSDIGPGDPTESILAKYDDQPGVGVSPQYNSLWANRWVMEGRDKPSRYNNGYQCVCDVATGFTPAFGPLHACATFRSQHWGLSPPTRNTHGYPAPHGFATSFCCQ